MRKFFHQNTIFIIDRVGPEEVAEEAAGGDLLKTVNCCVYRSYILKIRTDSSVDSEVLITN
jgi:hypothetical protein